MKTNLLWLPMGVFLAMLAGQTSSRSDKRIVKSPEFPKPLGPYSHAVVSGGFDGMNEVYREFFKGDYPARTTVQAVLHTGRRIEIDCIARVNQ